MDVIAYVAVATSIIFFVLYVRATVRSIELAKMGNRCIESEREAWQEADQMREKALAFQNSCRLITINRNGRMNVFTFQRNSDIFTIETMGMLADTPDDWRQQAGLRITTKPENT